MSGCVCMWNTGGNALTTRRTWEIIKPSADSSSSMLHINEMYNSLFVLFSPRWSEEILSPNRWWINYPLCPKPYLLGLSDAYNKLSLRSTCSNARIPRHTTEYLNYGCGKVKRIQMNAFPKLAHLICSWSVWYEKGGMDESKSVLSLSSSHFIRAVSPVISCPTASLLFSRPRASRGAQHWYSMWHRSSYWVNTTYLQDTVRTVLASSYLVGAVSKKWGGGQTRTSTYLPHKTCRSTAATTTESTETNTTILVVVADGVCMTLCLDNAEIVRRHILKDMRILSYDRHFELTTANFPIGSFSFILMSNIDYHRIGYPLRRWELSKHFNLNKQVSLCHFQALGGRVRSRSSKMLDVWSRRVLYKEISSLLCCKRKQLGAICCPIT